MKQSMFHQKLLAIPFDDLKIENVDPDKKEHISQILLQPEFIEAKYYQDQIQIIADFYNVGSLDSPISYNDIAMLFGRNKGTIYKTIQRGRLGYRRIGRPTLLNEEEIGFVKNLIYTKFENKEPVSFDFLLDALDYTFGTVISPDTLRHFCRALKGIKVITGIPMDNKRVDVDQDHIAQYYEELKEMTEKVPAKFIFNIDEAGCSSWADKHRIKVLVPESYEKDRISIPEDRNSKRSTLVGCIAADGNSFKPMIIVHRKTIDSDIKLAGYTEDRVVFACQEHGFMTTKLFMQWANEIFIPSVEELRQRENYDGSAILILDGLSAHHADDFYELCEVNNIKIKFLVPHSSDQCQPLDLVTFALVKREFTKKGFEQFNTYQSSQVIKMLTAWEKSTAKSLVTSAFRRAGLIQYLNGDEILIKVDPSKADQIRNWTPIDELPVAYEQTRRVRINQ